MVESTLLDSDVLYWRRGVIVTHETGKFVVESIQPASQGEGLISLPSSFANSLVMRSQRCRQLQLAHYLI